MAEAFSNDGTLTLNAVTVTGNTASGGLGEEAYGGGIFSTGSLSIISSAITDKHVRGR